MDNSFETPEPGSHSNDFIAIQNPLNIFLDVNWIEWRHIATESRTNTLCTIH